MIRIRYPDFSVGSRELAGLHAGLHGSAERDARGVTVYLLPGLTSSQRKAVIRRLRQEASRGFGPALPLPGLLVALGLDRMRAAAGTAVAIVRLHPALALPPGVAVAAMTLFMLAAAGGAPGPSARGGLDGALAGNGHAASALSGSALSSSALRRPVVGPVVGLVGPVVGPVIAGGGSELGSGALAPVWQARPRDRHRQRDRRHGQRDRRHGQRDRRHGQRDRRHGQHAGQISGRPAGS